MAGSATLTTVESTVTTVVPRMAATRTSRFCEAAGGGAAPFSILEEGVSVLPALVGELGDRDHPLVVVALHLVERKRRSRRRTAAERVADVALLTRRLHAVLVEVRRDPRQHRDLRVDVRHGRRQPLLVELPL